MRRLRDVLAPDDPESVEVIATGGLAPLIIRNSETITRHEPNLTLLGLRLIYERNDLSQQRARTHEIAVLASVVNRLGGAHILACGQPNIGIGWQSILAWDLGTNTGRLYFSSKYEKLHPQHTIVNMYPHSYGWQFFPSNWPGITEPAACHGLTYAT